MAVHPVDDPLGLARHYLELGRADSALAELEKADGSVDDPEFWALRAEALRLLERPAEAAEAAKEGLKREPESLELLDMLALAELDAGHDKEALAAIEAAVELYPDVAELHAHRALVLARRKPRSFRVQSFREARAAVDEALRLDPQSEEALRVRAQVAALSGDSRVGGYASEVLARDPEDELAHIMVGIGHAQRGDVATGLRHYEEAARLNPSDPALVWAGRYSREMQRPFFAPALLMERVTRGHIRLAWIAVAFASFQIDQPWLTVTVLSIWAYLWAVHLYLRWRVGKEPG
jgi:tetratricopeptide (TPR) repeat protein